MGFLTVQQSLVVFGLLNLRISVLLPAGGGGWSLDTGALVGGPGSSEGALPTPRRGAEGKHTS